VVGPSTMYLGNKLRTCASPQFCGGFPYGINLAFFNKNYHKLARLLDFNEDTLQYSHYLLMTSSAFGIRLVN
jgi:hypothetical protein